MGLAQLNKIKSIGLKPTKSRLNKAQKDKFTGKIQVHD